MANKKVQIQIDTKATGNGAKQASDDLKKLGNEADKTASKANSAAQSASRAASGRAAQVGFQVQDIAVQAQAGTAATTILAQQGSQLLSAFGPTGAILGGILAIGSAATGVFLKMGEDVESVEQKAEKLKEALDFVRENAEKLQSDRLDMGRKAIDEAIQLVQELRTAFQEAEAAEQKYSDSALQNVEALRLAQVELRRLRGEEINEIAEVAAKEEYNQKVIEQKRQKELQAAEARRNAALQEQADAQDLLKARAHALIQGQTELDQRIQQLNALKEQKKELEKIAKTPLPAGYAGGYGAMGGVRESPEATKAKQALATTPFDAQFQQLQGQIDALSKATTEQGGELYNGLIEAAKSLAETQAKIPDVLRTFEAEAARINESTSAEQITAAVQSEVEKAKARAAEVNQIIEGFVPATESQNQALAIIKQKTSDLKITADEAPIVAQNLALIQGALTANNAESAKSLQSILNALNTATTQLNKITQDAKRIEAQIIR